MSEDLDNADFWLSTDFLAGKTPVNSRGAAGTGGLFQFSSFGSNSLMNSPVESVVGSTETESDEDEYIAELTRKLTRSSVQDDLWKFDSGFRNETTKGRVMCTSPQSTLCGCKQNSSRGSPNCISPPDMTTVAKSAAAGWDLLYAAAGEVAKMRMAEEERSRLYQNQSRGQILLPLKTYNRNTTTTNHNLNHNTDLHPALAYRQLQAAQFQQMKQQQMMKRQGSISWNHSKSVGISEYHQAPQIVQNRTPHRSANMAPSSWSAPQQPQRMRAVFLGNSASKRESAGTGVFLPRLVGTSTESRKKHGCSTTVLVPDRVAQALNLNLESMESQPKIQPRCSNGSFTTQYDAALKYRNNVLMAQQRLVGVRPPPAISNELRLPQEWTY